MPKRTGGTSGKGGTSSIRLLPCDSPFSLLPCAEISGGSTTSGRQIDRRAHWYGEQVAFRWASPGAEQRQAPGEWSWDHHENTRSVHGFPDLDGFGLIRGQMKHLGGFGVVGAWNAAAAGCRLFYCYDRGEFQVWRSFGYSREEMAFVMRTLRDRRYAGTRFPGHCRHPTLQSWV